MGSKWLEQSKSTRWRHDLQILRRMRCTSKILSSSLMKSRTELSFNIATSTKTLTPPLYSPLPLPISKSLIPASLSHSLSSPFVFSLPSLPLPSPFSLFPTLSCSPDPTATLTSLSLQAKNSTLLVRRKKYECWFLFSREKILNWKEERFYICAYLSPRLSMLKNLRWLI